MNSEMTKGFLTVLSAVSLGIPFFLGVMEIARYLVFDNILLMIGMMLSWMAASAYLSVNILNKKDAVITD